MVYKARYFVQSRVEPQIFVSIFAVFMSTRNRHSYHDLVRVHLAHGSFFLACVDSNPIADL